MRGFIKYVLILQLSVFASAVQADIDSTSHFIQFGYFNSDGTPDIFAQALSNNYLNYLQLGLSDPTTGQYYTATYQSWVNNYLGLDWSRDTHNAFIGDFNGDALSEVLLQGNNSSLNHAVIATSGDGKLSSVMKTWNNGALGLNWDSSNYNLILGDYDGNGRTDVFLQGKSTTQTHAIVLSYGSALDSYSQLILNGYLGLEWSNQTHVIHTGDFNGDGRSDYILQPKYKFVLIPFDDSLTIPIPIKPATAASLLLSHPNGQLYAVEQSWDFSYLGIDWLADNTNIIVGDFNGDGIDEILLQSKFSGGTHHIVAFTLETLNEQSVITGLRLVQSFQNGYLGIDWSADQNRISLIQGQRNTARPDKLFFQGSSGSLRIFTPAYNNTNGLTSGSSVTTIALNPPPPPVHQPPVATNNIVFGVVAGSFDVTPNGAAGYSIPIAVPLGIGGMEPRLSLDYSNQNGNGPVGMGWSLGGFSSVYLCGKTIAQDGESNGINFDATDRLCLDGQRLVLISGTYGRNGATYRTENDTFSLITQYLDLPAAGVWFSVKTKAGQTIEYGNVDNARAQLTIAGITQTMSWSVYRIYDAAKNYLTVSYLKDIAKGQLLPSRIDYTANQNTAALTATRSVRFSYATRPDVITGYAKGAKTTLDKRLSNIKTYIGETLVMDYALYFSKSTTTKRSVMDYVYACNGVGECFPATKLEYQTALAWPAIKNTTDFCANNNFITNNPCDPIVREHIYYPNLNGDAYVDICFISTGGSLRCAFGRSSGFSATQSYGAPCANDLDCLKSLRFADMNGDGKDDLVWRNNISIKIQYWNGAGFAAASDTGVGGLTPEDNTLLSVNCENAGATCYTDYLKTTFTPDINGDGLADVCFLNPTGLSCKLNSGNHTFITVSGFNTPVCAIPRGTECYVDSVAFIDINTDGKQDLIYRSYQGIRWQFATSTGFATAITIADGVCGNGSGALGVCNDSDNHDTITYVDVTGDGLPDMCYRSDNYGVTCLPGNGQGFDTGSPIHSYVCANAPNAPNTDCSDLMSIRFGDINGDGKADFMFRSDSGVRAYVSRGTSFELYTGETWLGTICKNGTPYCDTYDDNYGSFALIDLNSDGISELVYRADDGVTWYASSGAAMDVLTKVTDGLSNQTKITYKPIADPTIYVQGTTCAYPEHCINGAMYVVAEYQASNGIGGFGKYSYTYNDLRSHQLGRGLLGFTSMTRFDWQSSISTLTKYDRTPQGTVTIPLTNRSVTGAVYPSLGMPILLETALVSGTGTINFAKYGSDFKTQAPQYILERTSNVVSSFATAGQAYFPYFVSSSETKYDYPSGAAVTQVTTLNEFTGTNARLSGELTNIVVTTTDMQTNETFSKQTQNVYQDNYVKWHLSRLSQSTVTHTGHGKVQTRKSQFVYNTSGQWDGMLWYTIEEPDALTAPVAPTDPTALKQTDYLKTTYEYDSFGEKKKVTVEGYAGIPFTLQTRESYSDYDLATINASQIKITTRNALNQTDTKLVDVRFGMPLSQTGPNGLTTNWQYDGFGRVITESRADGTQSTTSRGFCTTATCASVQGIAPVYFISAQATASQPANKYFDQLNRELRTETFDVNSNRIYKDTVYDVAGRVTKTSTPYFAGATQVYWGTVSYDTIGRIASETAPNGTTTTTGSSGLTTTTTVGRRSNLTGTVTSLVSVKQNFADGHLRKVIDAENGQVQYFYDAIGNLIETRAPGKAAGDLSNGDYVLTQMLYDKKGRKVRMIDPNMGTWDYTYDAFGNLLKEKDAKGNTVAMVYDKLNRMELRIEPVSLNRWEYDTATGAGIGKLHRQSGPMTITSTQYTGYLTTAPLPSSVATTSAKHQQTFTYDTLGRLVTTVTRMENGSGGYKTYQMDTVYDQYSRVAKTVYPTNVVNERFTVENVYDNYSYLRKVQNAVPNALGIKVMYWCLGDAACNTAGAVNARGQIEMFTQGSNVNTVRVYDATTGLLKDAVTSNTALQNTSYLFDGIGNLEKRVDQTQRTFNNADNLNETFSYDKLNRLTQVSLQGKTSSTSVITSYQYYANGNLRYRSGFGYYQYSATTRPHAVTNITSDAAGTTSVLQNAQAYSYDANGNMTAGDGRSLTYASYNLPTQITRGSATFNFYYGADHTRYRMTGPKGATYYLNPRIDAGTHFEHEEFGTVINDTHYLYAGGMLIGTHIVKGSGERQTRYFHVDHLGSIEAISNEFGQLVQRMSYDAFGLRRNLDWSNALSPIVVAEFHHGFTAHEHLDEIGLIHMNGRVYDPKLGRFQSADPNIQAPGNSQSFNRYSYVINNPLSLTDPSGFLFSGLRKGFGKAAPYVRIGIIIYSSYLVGNAAGNWYGGTNAAVFGGAVGGAYAAVLSRGNVIRGALTGAAFGYVGHGAGIEDEGLKMLAHGVVGGLSNRLDGQKFSQGFIAAFAGEAITLNTKGILNGFWGGLVKASVAGGIGSELGGGKFGDGAITAAFGYLFNEAGGDQSSEDEYESRPYYEDIAEAYETDGLALIDRVGGKLKVNFDTNKSFSEGGTCAVRVSSACNLGGDPIPAKKDLPKGVRMLKDAEGNSYIYSAGEFAKYVSNRYGPPENIKSFDVISGKKGFIYFSSGHVDLFDGSDLVGNTGQGNDYLNRSSRVQFWQLPSRPSD